jgi:hypothetical protein
MPFKNSKGSSVYLICAHHFSVTPSVPVSLIITALAFFLCRYRSRDAGRARNVPKNEGETVEGVWKALVVNDAM